MAAAAAFCLLCIAVLVSNQRFDFVVPLGDSRWVAANVSKHFARKACTKQAEEKLEAVRRVHKHKSLACLRAHVVADS